jgi:diacylglycerol kinase (ATP)
MEEKILFVVNPVAGGKDKSLFWSSLDQALNVQPFEYLTYTTDGVNDVTQLRHILQTQICSKVIVVGGDGTVKLVAEQLVHQPTALGIIPMGSANGMARELGLPVHPKEALQVALGTHSIQIDTIHISGYGLCIHLSDMGLNATLVENYQTRKLRGMRGYAHVFFRTFLNRNRFRIYLVNETLNLNRSVYMVMLANARMFGTGALINPGGSLQDGLFEVVMMKDVGWWDLPGMFLPNRKSDAQKVETVSVKSIDISTTRPVHFQIDGEYKSKVNHIQASIIARSLRVITAAKPKEYAILTGPFTL